MKTITLDEALTILNGCAAVIVDDGYVTFATLLDQEDPPQPDDIFLELSPGENDPSEQHFAVADNQTVEINEQTGCLVFVNTLGEKTMVMRLVALPCKEPLPA